MWCGELVEEDLHGDCDDYPCESCEDELKADAYDNWKYNKYKG